MSQLERLIQHLCPDGVEYQFIGKCCDVSAGGDVTKDRFSEISGGEYSIPIISNGIGENSIYGYTDVPKITRPAVTIAARGTIGYPEYRDYPFFPIIRLLSLVPNNPQKLDTKFLYYALQGRKYSVPTTGIPQLTAPTIKKERVPCPPLEVQREIVRILDQFTELTTELSTKLDAELTARKKQYAYYRDALLTFDSSTQFERLGDTCNMKAGKAIAARHISPVITNDAPYQCYGGNGVRGYVNMASHHGEFPIIGRQGALCGNVNYANGDFYATEHAVVVESKGKYIQKFLYYLLLSMNLNQYKSQGAQPGLAVGNLENLIAPVPTLEEQHRIVSILDRFDTLCNDLTSGLPAEIKARQKQYEYYRDKLLNFKELK